MKSSIKLEIVQLTYACIKIKNIVLPNKHKMLHIINKKEAADASRPLEKNLFQGFGIKKTHILVQNHP